MKLPGPGRTLRPSGSHRTTRLSRCPFIYPPAAAISTLCRTFRMVFTSNSAVSRYWLRGAKQRRQRHGSPVYLSPSCWSPMTPPIKRRVERVTPSAHGSHIASFVRSFHPSKNSIQHWWYNRTFRAEVDSKPLPGRLSLLSSYTGIHPTGIQLRQLTGFIALILMQIEQTHCTK